MVPRLRHLKGAHHDQPDDHRPHRSGPDRRRRAHRHRAPPRRDRTRRRSPCSLGCSTFDVVAVADDLDMWLDDEGLLTDRRPNLLASQLVLQITGRLQRWVGDVVFTGGVDPEGDSMPLSQARLDGIRELVAD